MKIGDPVTVVTIDGELLFAKATSVHPLIGTAPFPGFAWTAVRYVLHAQRGVPVGRDAYYRFDREGIDWIPGHSEPGSMDFDAFLAARKLVHSTEGSGR